MRMSGWRVGAAWGLLAGIALAGADAGEGIDAAAVSGQASCPVRFEPDWLMSYIWKDPKRGMNVYDGHMTLRNAGGAPLADLAAVVEVLDVVTGKVAARTGKPVAFGTLAAGASKKLAFSVPHSPKGDEIVVRLSAKGADGRPATWFFSTDDPMRPPEWLDPDLRAPRLLGQRLDAGKAGRKSTSMNLTVKAANLSRRPLPSLKAEVKVTVERAQGKNRAAKAETVTRVLDLAKADKPMAPGEIRTFSVKFEIEGDMKGHQLELVADYGPGGPGGADEDADFADAEKEPDIHIGGVALLEEGGRLFARVVILNTFAAGDEPGKVALDLATLDGAGNTVGNYPLVIENVAAALPRGKRVERKIPVDGAGGKVVGVNVGMQYE